MSIFKAYDIRGIYPEQLNETLAYNIGRAFVTFTNAKQVVVGYDARLSSESIFEAVTKGMIDQGANVVNIGLTSTPMFNFTHAHFGYQTGVMVTASHNPKEYNGFKMNVEGATPLTGDSGIKDIEKLALLGEFVDVKIKGTISEKDHLDEYVDFMVGLVKRDLSTLKVVVDASSGAVGNICKKVFKKLHINYIPLNFEPDGNFPSHDPNPLKGDSQKQAQNAVKAEGADLGCLFDADADRIIFVDETGTTIQPDFVAALVAKKALKDSPGDKVLYDCISSRIIPKTIKDNGGIPIVVRVGRSYIYLAAKQNDVIFGAEASSHYYHREVYHGDNGVLTLLKLMELLVDEQKPVSELVKPYQIYVHSGEVNLEVESNEIKDAKIAEITEKFSDGEQSTLDGIGVIYDDVWFNVRKSNTEPVLRLRIEGKTKEAMEDMKNKLLDIVNG
jgi:phosphomannomutase